MVCYTPSGVGEDRPANTEANGVAAMTDLVHEYLPGGDRDAPLLLLLHGTGGDERDILPLGRLLWPGAPVLAPRGPVSEEDGVPRFFHRIPLDPTSEGVNPSYPYAFDDDDIGRNVGRVAEFVNRAREEYDMAARPLVAAGFSNGANLAASTLLLRPGFLRAAVCFSPMPVLSAPPSVDLSETAVLLVGGRHDPIATPQHVETLGAWLGDRGAAVELKYHDGGHELPRSAVEAAAEWLKRLRHALGIDASGLP
jgi:phospholipase/carboxylesterase